MNLLVINDAGLSGGGAEHRVRLLLEEYLRQGIFKQIHLLQYDKNSFADYQGITFHHTNRGGMRATYSLTRQIISKYKIDIVQAHNMLLLTPSCILAARKQKVPVVWLAHDYWVICAMRSFIDPDKASQRKLCEQVAVTRCLRQCTDWRTLLRLWMFRQMIKQVDVAVAPTMFVKELYERHNVLLEKWRIVKPWICLDKFSYSNSNPYIERNKDIVFVGSLMDFKGAWVAVRALKYIVRKCPEARLVFIGNHNHEQQYKEGLESLCRQEDVLERVEFSGNRDWESLAEIHCRAGVYVCPTVCMESFGLNWAEAMACSCPVIASNVGSIPELIDGNGLLVKPGDPLALAEAVIRVLTDKDCASELSRKGAEYACISFKVESAVRQMVGIFNDLVAL